MPQTIDPLEALLKRSPLAGAQRAELWDLYESSGTADDLAAKLETYGVPQQVKAQLWTLKSQETAPVPSEVGPQAPQGGAVGRFLSNAGEMINPVSIVTGAYNAIRHPVDTGKAILQQSGEQLSKAGRAYDEGRTWEAAGHALGAVPVIGPIAAEAGEQIAAGDVAGGLGKAAGMLVPFGAAEGLARVGVKGVPKRVAGALEQGAAERVADVMRPKAGSQAGRRLGNRADDIAPEIAADPSNMAWSRAGMAERVGSKLEDMTAALDAASDARLAARTFDTDEILSALRKRRQRWVSEAVEGSRTIPALEEITTGSAAAPPRARLGTPSLDKPSLGKPSFTDPPPPPKPEFRKVAGPLGKDVVPGPNQARVAAIDKAISEIEQLGPKARYESLRRIREAYDKPARAKYNPSLTDDFLKKTDEAAGAADVTGTLREHLAKFDPDTATANAGYSLYKTADDVLQAAIEIDKAKPKVGRQIITRLTTTLGGGQAGGAAGALAGFTLAPVADAMLNAGFTTKLKTAQAMNDLAKAIRSGDVGRVNSASFKVRQLVKQAEASRARGSEALTPSMQEQ